MIHITRDNLAAARAMFRRALQLDPNFGLPWTGLSRIDIIEALYAWTDDARKTLSEALDAARRALALDDMNAGAHRSLSYAHMFSGHYAAAIAEAQRAVELNPSYAMGYHALGVSLFSNGQPMEGIDALTRAIRMSPNDPMMYEMLGALSVAYHLAGDYEKAVEAATASARKASFYPIARRTMASALAHLGRLDEARAALEEFLALSPGFTIEAARHAPPLRRESDFQRFVDGLRNAGWQG
jgi:adenylate cyclase